MASSKNEDTRIKQRFDVDLKAEASLDGKEQREYQCRVKNLSATGACLHFETAIKCKIGMDVAVKLFIPETIMHIPNSAEIIWVKQQQKKIDVGIHFKDILSEIMMQRLVKNGVPEKPYNPE